MSGFGQRVITKSGAVLRIGKVIVDDDTSPRRKGSPDLPRRAGERAMALASRTRRAAPPAGSGPSGWSLSIRPSSISRTRSTPTQASLPLTSGAGTSGSKRRNTISRRPTTPRRSGSTPRTPNAYIGRGAAWIEKKEYDKAIADCNEALHIDPNDVAVLVDRGKALSSEMESSCGRRRL